MHPSIFASSTPDKPAVIMAASGEILNYGALDRRSNQGAQLFRREGLGKGDVVAFLIENRLEFFELVWAAQRAGLYYVCISTQLMPSEIQYIVQDSGAKLLVASSKVEAAHTLPDILSSVVLFILDRPLPGFRFWDEAAALMPPRPIADQSAGTDMLYSSGTTGRPKGIKPTLDKTTAVVAETPLDSVARSLGFDNDTVYLTPAPLYHAAPLRWSMLIHRLGGTAVILDKFDAEIALAAIERYGVTHSQWVPTHFIRLLKLPEAIKAKYDVSSMVLAIHAAAPCPVPVKRAMIEWWGPILLEYYAGTESNGMTMIGSEEWLERPGSVGRSVIGNLHICDETGAPVAARTEGEIYFEGGTPFVYHNDPAKTNEATHPEGWTTIGDVGWTDEDGYLYLTDRKSFMIISGGVNVYPQEIENILVVHPRVADAAVFGAPHPEMGEMIVAVIQPADWADANLEFAEELTDWLRPQISGVKIPRKVDFMKSLPRFATGKLHKRLIRDRYWGHS